MHFPRKLNLMLQKQVVCVNIIKLLQNLTILLEPTQIIQNVKKEPEPPPQVKLPLHNSNNKKGTTSEQTRRCRPRVRIGNASCLFNVLVARSHVLGREILV